MKKRKQPCRHIAGLQLRQKEYKEKCQELAWQIQGTVKSHMAETVLVSAVKGRYK